MASSGAAPMRNAVFREVYKNAWLHLTNSGCKTTKKDKFWMVFCVHDDTDAYLEAYIDRGQASTHNPRWYIKLNNTLHITSTICSQDQEFEFVITLDSDMIKLSAPTWQLMIDWVETLRRKLAEMRVLSPNENLYSPAPRKNISSPLLPSRDPTSPLPPPPGIPAPQPSHYERLSDGFSGQTPLRTRQVEELRKEISHPAGVRLKLRRQDCTPNAIALAEAFGGVWVAGWKQKEHPLLYNAFHIGDRLVSVGDKLVSSVNEARKALQAASSSHPCSVDILVKRLPHAKTYAIQRDTLGQSLGLVREDAIITAVDPDGLAARFGLPAKAPTCDGLSLTNWVLTEVNGRPLNLFFRDDEIAYRLNSVGRDISILVQPLDFVKQLKKQLRALRNYKDYIVQ